MKKYLWILSIIVLGCCSKPAPEKVTRLTFGFTSKKDTVFFKNIKRIYAMGSVTNNSQFTQDPRIFDTGYYGYEFRLPISYAFDSTVYIFENKIKTNDTIIVYYKRNVSYDGGSNCGYQQTLSSSPKDNYSTLKKYNLDVYFGTYGIAKGLYSSTDDACTIKLYEK